MSHLENLNSVRDLDEALNESKERSILLFKHSLTCPISARAFSELQSHLERADSRVSYKLITVQSARAISDEAASRLGVTHQSPQAILVRDGRPVWNASHSEITVSALDGAIRNLA
ncbi:MAG TPA: bacillithiol system redox-active protein YtxJ [Blastocatellia bacterium]|nr:bacillithiol system redox-active protein YtxJ [Blastocatellia bacterium]